MFHKISRVTFWVVPILVVILFPLRLTGQETAKNAEAAERNAKAKQSVTGCLQKGDEAGGFVLTAEDGKTWELSGNKVKLADDVGHKVKVTGSPTHQSKEGEEKMEKSEKKEAGEKEYADLKVHSLAMVSDSCK